MKSLPRKIRSMGASLHRRQRPPTTHELVSDSNRNDNNPLDRTLHSGSRSRHANRAYAKYDYPADPLGGTGHGTQRTSTFHCCYGSDDSSHHNRRRPPIPAEITIKLDDCADGADAARRWLIRKAPPPEGEEARHTTTTTASENMPKKNDNDNEEEEQHKAKNATGDLAHSSSPAASHRHDNDQEDAEASAPPPPSYDECVQLGLIGEERRTKAATATSAGATSSVQEADTCITSSRPTTTQTTSDALATAVPREVHGTTSLPNTTEEGAGTGMAERTGTACASTPFSSTNDLLSYGFQADDDDGEHEEEQGLARMHPGRSASSARHPRKTLHRRGTTTTTTTTSLSIQSEPTPLTTTTTTISPCVVPPPRLVHHDSLLSTSRSMASEESVREEMGRILAALRREEDEEEEEQSTPNKEKESRSSSSSSSPSSSRSRPVYLDVPPGTSLYPRLGRPEQPAAAVAVPPVPTVRHHSG